MHSKEHNLHDQEIITAIIDYFMEHQEKEFDLGFVCSCQEYLDQHNVLTYSQRMALNNMLGKFRINENLH